ncbi:MAG: non-canonical purine NTP pyrophosphatase [Candidatus Roizmanbacteria bacterium]
MKNSSDLIMVTGNEGKAKEVSLALGKPVHQVDLHLDEIQSLELAHIVRRKAEDAFKILQKPLLTDDAGLFVPKWEGFPGPFVKYITGPQLMLEIAKSLTDRRAYFVCAMAYHDGQTIHIAEGRIDGKLSTEMIGNGWGFDSIFFPDESSQTMGQLRDSGVKIISHRYKALEQLKKLFT